MNKEEIQAEKVYKYVQRAFDATGTPIEETDLIKEVIYYTIKALEQEQEEQSKEPENCPHCGEAVNYLNYREHLYINCVSPEVSDQTDELNPVHFPDAIENFPSQVPEGIELPVYVKKLFDELGILGYQVVDAENNIIADCGSPINAQWIANKLNK